MKQDLLAMGNEQLLSALRAVVGKERAVVCEWLTLLAEVEARRLHEGLGFPSVWMFCTRSLGLCETTAARRIAAARVCRTYPQALDLVANGTLQLTLLSLLQPHLSAENADELFALCSGTSFREAERAIAARFPKPDFADSIRRLPAARHGTSNVGSPQPDRVASSLRPECLDDAAPTPSDERVPSTAPPVCRATEPTGGPERTCAGTLMSEKTPASEPNRTIGKPSRGAPLRLLPLSEDRFGVRFTASAEFRDLLERVRALASHRLPSGDLATLLQRGLEAYERELLKQRFAVGENSRTPKRSRARSKAPQRGGTVAECPRASSASGATKRAVSGSRTRNIPASVRRAVYERDGGQCTFTAEDGRRCEARHFLEYDHIEPHALGGPPTTQNLRLRCGAHNRWSARLYFRKARARIDAPRTAPSATKPARSAPVPKT